MSHVNWKVTFQAKRDQSENGSESGGPSFEEKCKAQVEILQIPGEEEKYCVTFSRKAGSAMLFYDKANMYINEMELYNNTTIDD